MCLYWLTVLPKHCFIDKIILSLFVNHIISKGAITSVANTPAKPWNWATFDPVLTHKNYKKPGAKNQLHVSLWALIWRRGLRSILRRGLVNVLLATLTITHWLASPDRIYSERMCTWDPWQVDMGGEKSWVQPPVAEHVNLFPRFWPSPFLCVETHQQGYGYSLLVYLHKAWSFWGTEMCPPPSPFYGVARTIFLI